MIRTEPICVFAYAFAHRKTQDFLLELAAARYRNVTVIAAPWKPLPHVDTNQYYPTSRRPAGAQPTAAVCEMLGFSFISSEHDDIETITALRDVAGFRLGIISGARIIKRAVIELFDEGILNIHPGKLPETAGLDLFYYTIKKKVPLGATAHFIDPRVDAGVELFFEETVLGPDDSIEAVLENNYSSQIVALRGFFAKRDSGSLVRRPVDRPNKNQPMSSEEKRVTLQSFPQWRLAQYRAQVGRELLKSCSQGNATRAEELLAALPDLIEFRSDEGWTPLIIAAFGQHLDLVRVLLARGADPNACGRKGTTVLMYAKTALVETNSPDLSILETLMQAGADPSRCDAFGKDIYHYLGDQRGSPIACWLAAREKKHDPLH